MRNTIFAATVVAAAAFTLPAMAQSVQRVRGTIDSLNGYTLVVKSRTGGEQKIELAPNVTVVSVIPAQLSDIKPGTFVGTAATGPKDKLQALEVLIFPEAMRGTGEGHYAWDLQPESTMTNAIVESDTQVSGTNGRELTLKAKGETLKVAVPQGVPIVTFAPGELSMLKPGQKVFIGAQKAADGSLSAARVAVGKDGMTPPM